MQDIVVNISYATIASAYKNIYRRITNEIR